MKCSAGVAGQVNPGSFLHVVHAEEILRRVEGDHRALA